MSDGAIDVPAFSLPESGYLSETTRQLLARRRQDDSQPDDACPPLEGAAKAAISDIRACEARAFEDSDLYKAVRKRFPVRVAEDHIAGVRVQTFTPTGGVRPRNRGKILINLHGGGFFSGSMTGSQTESIPIASLSGFEVISVDYRLAPEHTFPAAVEDAVSVYRVLLARYGAKHIGIYGCSAGGYLTAQAIAAFQRQSLALPAAVGVLCAGAGRAAGGGKDRWLLSDSSRLNEALTGKDSSSNAQLWDYWRTASDSDPIAYPGDHDEVMRKFPPTLLVAGGRDHQLSSAIVTHAQLVKLGVPAELHVWEGMTHGFPFDFDPSLPEALEAEGVVAKFFETHLSASKSSR